MQNHLKDQVSPYLLQHVNNPVDWYPWCQEAFDKAKAEDKPVFLSIGYSTCHWCHVMAHESFEDQEIADILNKYFISIKVDKEERPDIDSIYMAVCQAFTGSGGWPTTIFLAPDQRPFFAGTYFPKTARYGQPGLKDLLLSIHRSWRTDRKALLESADKVIAYLAETDHYPGDADQQMIDNAVGYFKRSYDETFGGFGQAPKFPTAHNLLFLLTCYEKSKDEEALEMVEYTLLQMYRGGMFDHIGGGFSRYSTDRYFLVPHFEKMLYDNALLILAYCRAYQLTKKPIYRTVAEKTAGYLLREMTAPEGGFYSAQDADSDGVEGKYYVFEPAEIINLLGEETGKAFNDYFNITEQGNFEGKSIPNLLSHPDMDGKFEQYLPTVYEYRRQRCRLHLDDKVLTAWNGLMIAAMCHLYRVTGDNTYLEAAIKAQRFIEEKLCEQDTLFVSYRNGKRGEKGFLDEYANEIFALIALYEATFEPKYLERAKRFCDKTLADFHDEAQGGFFLYGRENEQLIIRPKDSNSGAVPSGNSLMAYNLVQLYYLTDEARFGQLAEQQIAFVTKEAGRYPMGNAMFLVALSDYLDPPEKITVVVKAEDEGGAKDDVQKGARALEKSGVQKENGTREKDDRREERGMEELACRTSLSAVVRVLTEETGEYRLKNDRTTYYVCKGRMCLEPRNELGER